MHLPPRTLLATAGLLAIAITFFACGDATSPAIPEDGSSGALPGEGEGEGGDAAGNSDGSAADSADDGSQRDASTDAPSDADADADADGGPACVAPALPTTACPNGTAATFSEQILPSIPSAWTATLRIDRGGFFHAVTTRGLVGGGVDYVTNRSGTWTIETVVGAGLGTSHSRLAVNPCGQPIVLYKKAMGSDRSLFLARKVGATWVHEPINTPTSSSNPAPATDIEESALAIDASGEPFVVFTRGSGGTTVLIATRGATGWATEDTGLPILFERPVAIWSATMGLVIALPSFDAQRVLTVARKVGGIWQTSQDPTGTRARFQSGNDDPGLGIAAAADGTVHLAYLSDPGHAVFLKHATVTTSGWTTPTTVPFRMDRSLPALPQILLPQTGESRIYFEQNNGSNHVYVSRKAEGVFPLGVEVGPYPNFYPSAFGSVIDDNGREHVLLVGGTAPIAEPARLLTENCLP